MTVTYTKYRSVESFSSKSGDLDSVSLDQTNRVIEQLSTSDLAWPMAWRQVLSSVVQDLQNGGEFSLTPYIADEMARLEDADLPRYLFHRYRYDIWPSKRELDETPPYLQIEPVSFCNYRCVFCYQTDRTYFRKNAEKMGYMDPGLFREILEDATGKVEFISLASRGEPLLHPCFEELMSATEGRFLNLKINTNAALLDESKSRAILESGVGTVVFSADAATPELYKRLRVGGDLARVLRNIENFQAIRAKDYSRSRVITRVSGVKVSDEQSLEQMKGLWGNLVDQVAFVSYNPWENIYAAPANGITSPCSDLWRRMFVWWDGVINPCDSDYKSRLSVGKWEGSIGSIWTGEEYTSLRARHSEQERVRVEPCSRCSVI